MKTGVLTIVEQHIAAGIRERAAIARKSGLTSQQVGNALKRLRDRGILERGKGSGIPAPIATERTCLLSELWK